MGRAEAHRSDHKTTPLQVIVDAMNLHAHTCRIMAEMKSEAAKLGLELHPEKTRIVSAKDGAVLLGFHFRVDDKGKVLMLRDPKRVKEVRRRLRRLANKEKRGEVNLGAVDESYRCVRACMEKGNSMRLLRNMDNYVNTLKEEINGRNNEEIYAGRSAA